MSSCSKYCHVSHLPTWAAREDEGETTAKGLLLISDYLEIKTKDKWGVTQNI